MVKSLLTISALFEGATGLALLIMPSTVLSLLIGISFKEPGLQIVTGVTGVSLITLAIVCWLLRNSRPYSNIVVKAMLFYNVAAGLVLIYAGIGLHLSAIGLWPTVVIHVGLALWCIISFKK